MELTGKQRTAVLLLAMGDKFTADVFKRMDRQEIADISRAIVELEPVPREIVKKCCANSTNRWLKVWI